MTQRLDQELVSRGIFASRAKAQEAIAQGAITVNGKPATKPSMKVSADDEISLEGATLAYVSRAGLKLEHALDAFGIDMSGRILLDIGSSTGGFTDCALQRGALRAFAVDVGRDQLAPALRADPRVTAMEGLDFRELDPQAVQDADIASIDVSFISVTKLAGRFTLLPRVSDIICLVKPQFECGKSIARRTKGVPLDIAVHAQAITAVADSLAEAGFSFQNLCASPIRGQSGNIEYLAHFERTGIRQAANAPSPNVDGVVRATFERFGIPGR